MDEVTLYLAPWQMRMLKDFSSKARLGAPLEKITKMILRNPKGTCLASYKLPAKGMIKDDWLIYLTDEQMVVIKDKLKLRAQISSVNVSPEAVKSSAIVFT